MKKAVVIFLLVLVPIILLCELANAQTVRLRMDLDSSHGNGTAVCVGHTAEGASVLLTAKHNFRGARSGSIFHDGRWIVAEAINQHPSEDVLSFEVAANVPALQLADAEQIGAPVEIRGYGPEYHGRKASAFLGVMETGYVAGRDGLHPIPGDSGGPVLQNERVVGIIQGYFETAYRSDRANERLSTSYAGLQSIRECLQQCYQQCPPSGCKIWIRNEYRQPVVPLGLPRGPVQRVQVAEPVPRVYVPEDQPRVNQPAPVVQQGPPGPQGPPGRDGRSVTVNEVEAAVNAWLDANREQLIGPQGPPGPPGQSGSAANVTHLESRLTVLEQRPFRIILSSDGKVIDDETYRPGEPVVLDLKRLRSVSDAK
jgi:hypothetical protein